MADDLAEDEWWHGGADHKDSEEKSDKGKKEKTSSEKKRQKREILSSSEDENQENQDADNSKLKTKQRKKRKTAVNKDTPSKTVIDSSVLWNCFHGSTKGKLSKMELDELKPNNFDECFLNDTIEPYTSLDQLSPFLIRVIPRWTKAMQSIKPKCNGSPALLIVCSSAKRSVEINRAIKSFKTSTCKTAKLFAKHFKLEEQQEFLSTSCIHVGVGTPNRILKLVNDDYLKLKKLKYVVFDWNYKDPKQRRMIDIPEKIFKKELIWKEGLISIILGVKERSSMIIKTQKLVVVQLVCLERESCQAFGFLLFYSAWPLLIKSFTPGILLNSWLFFNSFLNSIYEDVLNVFKVVRVTPNTPDDVAYLQGLAESDMEIDFWIDPSEPGHPVDVNLDARHFVKLVKVFKKRGMKYVIYLKDVQKAIDDENLPGISDQNTFASGGYDYASYNTLSSINTELSNVANRYSSFVTKFNMGKSFENRNMYALKIQSQKGATNKKTVFMNCGIHAREWISPATCMYMIKQFVEKYSQGNAEIRALVQKYDWVILPVFNVDGYVYTHTGQRLWRKTRSGSGSCRGTDPNRNWNYKWGGAGTSSYPCSDIYHGSRPFSEIEVLSVARYLYSIRHNLVAYYDIHAYSQLWLTPWSYKTNYPTDYAEIKRVADASVAALKTVHGKNYRVGPPSRILYSVAGGSIDWTYAVLGVKYSYALELRDEGQYGFLLPADQITPTGEETFKAIITAAKEYR
eukprot:gene621-1286_t